MSNLKFKYHGNYCGPNYCGGSFAKKCDFSVEPVDELDAACRLHDYSYDVGNNAAGDDALARAAAGLAMRGNLKAAPVALYFGAMGADSNTSYGKQYPDPIQRLVGVEPNPGPPKRANRPKKKTVARAASSAPVAYRTIQSPIVGDGVVTFKHREYVTDVTGSVAFVSKIFPVNPTVSQTFKWLSGVASNWNNYNFGNLKFEFIGRCSSSVGGSVMMAVDYDSTEAAPTTKQELLNYKNAVSSNSWTSSALVCDPKDLHKQVTYFTQCNDASRQCYVGNMVLGVSGQADTSVVGELWVSYEVRLYTPRVSGWGPTTVATLVTTGTGGVAAITAGTTIASSGSDFVSLYASNWLQFDQDGEFYVLYQISGTGISGPGALTWTIGAAAVAPTTANIAFTNTTTLALQMQKIRVYRGNLLYITAPDWTTASLHRVLLLPATYSML